jgi:hypothetical protein
LKSRALDQITFLYCQSVMKFQQGGMAHESLNVSATSGGSKPMPCLSPDFTPLLSPTRMDGGRERKQKHFLTLTITKQQNFKMTYLYTHCIY